MLFFICSGIVRERRKIKEWQNPEFCGFITVEQADLATAVGKIDLVLEVLFGSHDKECTRTLDSVEL